MNGCITVWDDVSLEELKLSYKNDSRPNEVYELIWNEDFIRKSLGIKILRKELN